MTQEQAVKEWYEDRFLCLEIAIRRLEKHIHHMERHDHVGLPVYAIEHDPDSLDREET